MTLPKGSLTLLLLAIAAGQAFAADTPKTKTTDKRAVSGSFTCWFLVGPSTAEPQSLGIKYEYSREFLEHHLPQGAGKDFHWSVLPKGAHVESRPLMRRNKRNYLEICYQSPPSKSSRHEHWDVMLAYETSEGWLRPVYVAYADGDRYASSLVSTNAHPLGLNVNMEHPGQVTSHYLFDLWNNPRLVTKATSSKSKKGNQGPDSVIEIPAKVTQKKDTRRVESS